MKRWILTVALVIACGANALAANIKIKNESPWRIDHVYISPNWSNDFGEDRLRDDQVIDPGETWTISFRGGDECIWDFRVTFHNGVHRTLYNQNLCLYDDPIWNVQ